MTTWRSDYFFLWTDGVIYLLTTFLVLYVIFGVKNYQWRYRWSQIIFSYRGITTLMFLVLYLGVGIADSIHFKLIPTNVSQGNIQIKSVLDIVLSPIGERGEKSYSAPLEDHLFVKETYRDTSGVLQHVTLPLQHVNKNMKSVFHIVIEGIAYGVMYWAVVLVLLYGVSLIKIKLNMFDFLSKKKKKRRLIYAAWLLFFVIEVVVVGLSLAQHYYIFGTNKVGLDVFYLVLKSIKTSLIISSLTTFFTLPFPILFGVCSGYCRGWVDDVIQFVYTVLSAIPTILLVSACMLVGESLFERYEINQFGALYQADLKLILLCFILGITGWTTLCRLIRAEVLKLRETNFVLAAQGLGITARQIMTKHLIRNVLHLILIISVLDFSSLILAEAILSYVGIGIDPSLPSFGNLINQASTELSREPVIWWSLTACFIFMSILVLSVNLLADVIRESYDPRLSI